MPFNLEKWKKLFKDETGFDGEIVKVESVRKADVHFKVWQDVGRHAVKWGVPRIYCAIVVNKPVFSLFYDGVWHSHLEMIP